MKRIDLLGKLCPIAIVAHDIIGSRQALLARGLRGQTQRRALGRRLDS